MTDEDTQQKIYRLVTSAGEERAGSRGFTGTGRAEYPNGDVYEGEFVEGVDRCNADETG